MKEKLEMFTVGSPIATVCYRLWNKQQIESALTFCTSDHMNRLLATGSV